MATLGDPLADLGLFLVYWGATTQTTVDAAPTHRRPDAGFLTRDEVVERYATAVGPRRRASSTSTRCSPSYKLAIILEGIHARYLMGKTVGEGFDHIGAMVESIASSALDRGSRSSIAALRG